ncbi:GNAT family N-acetyltransferase [Myroides pelagicus]|uniref:GNAT family N-acetyltransferase n=1 Tax=Myroides pelagicus TaxID=270914 RepID=A0A7K1GMD6_9FLAO|nr:GNAT family N-acetyltransferase [Myroides pelagicus]MTH30016.1 GNAT family N-acetyltransferase [Myroides pelagicus]
MIRRVKVTDYPRLMEIWESSVLNTHDFLKKEDFFYYKENIPIYFEHVQLWGYEEQGVLMGFMGLAEDSLEMLFIHAEARGRGIGKVLVAFGRQKFGITKVDVNEQNEQAIGFYEHLGFGVVGRSQEDGSGKPYPVLHMALK